MTIFVESLARELDLPNAKRIDALEARTGADMMISRLSMPATSDALLRKHLAEGALLIQVKVSEDIASSASSDRLVDSLARMRDYAPRSCQRWLLFIGTLGCDNEGCALINGHRSHQSTSFVTIDGAITAWIARGGSYYALAQHRAFAQWCGIMERRLQKWSDEPYRFALASTQMPDDLPQDGDVLQLPVRVRDARRVLIGFEGLGVDKVNRVWEYCGRDYKSALAFLTDPSSVGKLEGIGAKTIASIRRQCGLGEDDGYIGWGRDEVDKNVIVPKETDEDAPKRDETQLEKDHRDLFGKPRKATVRKYNEKATR